MFDRILVTGAGGFTGRALLTRLPGTVFGIDRITPADTAAFSEFFEADLADASKLRSILKKTQPNAIINLAGLLKGNAVELFQANTQNTVQLLEAAAAAAPNASVLLIGSAAEYGFAPQMDGVPFPETYPCDPRGPYGISKYAMTLIAQDFVRRASLKINIARTFNLIGPNIPPSLLLGALIQRVREALKTNAQTIVVGNVEAERDFIDVRDAVDAYLSILSSGASGEVFNVCTGRPTRIQALVESALACAPRKIGYTVDPALLRADDPKCVIGDASKMRRLGWEPAITVEQSLADSCAVLRAP